VFQGRRGPSGRPRDTRTRENESRRPHTHTHTHTRDTMHYAAHSLHPPFCSTSHQRAHIPLPPFLARCLTTWRRRRLSLALPHVFVFMVGASSCTLPLPVTACVTCFEPESSCATPLAHLHLPLMPYSLPRHHTCIWAPPGWPISPKTSYSAPQSHVHMGVTRLAYMPRKSSIPPL
jgi:hypothetical protein